MAALAVDFPCPDRTVFYEPCDHAVFWHLLADLPAQCIDSLLDEWSGRSDLSVWRLVTSLFAWLWPAHRDGENGFHQPLPNPIASRLLSCSPRDDVARPASAAKPGCYRPL